MAENDQNIETIMSIGGWKSSKVARGYIQNSMKYKRCTESLVLPNKRQKVSDRNSITQTTSPIHHGGTNSITNNSVLCLSYYCWLFSPDSSLFNNYNEEYQINEDRSEDAVSWQNQGIVPTSLLLSVTQFIIIFLDVPFYKLLMLFSALIINKL